MNINNDYYVPQEMEIDLVELMWRMLSQWKAILVCSLIMALLVPSVVYLRDSRAYDVAKTEAEKMSSDSANSQKAIEDLLAALTPEDRPAVEQALRNDEIIEAKIEYLNNSILVNLDVDKATTAVIGYMIYGEASENNDLKFALFEGYSAAFCDNASLSEIMEAMEIESEPKYIKELVWDEGTLDNETSNVFKINIICPNASMVENVAKTTDNIMARTCESLSKTVCKHSVKRIFTQSSPRTLESVSTTAGNAYGALYNLQSQQRAHIGTFNEDQKAAYEAIVKTRNALKNCNKAADNSSAGEANNSKDLAIKTETGKLAKPEFNKKYAVLGFAFGAFFYVMLYVVWLVLRRRIDNAKAAQAYTGARLLGEYYRPAKKSGLSVLFHSKAVTKHRFADKIDLSAQADKIAEAITASCANKGIKEIALLQMFEDTAEENTANAGVLIREVSERLKSSDTGLVADTIIAFPAPNVKDLSDTRNVAFFIADSTKTATLYNTLLLCKDYEIGRIGIVFIGQE